MKEKVTKIIFFIIMFTGVAMVVLINEFNKYTQSYFYQNNMIEEQFIHIQSRELKLKHEVLMSSLYLYANNDLIMQDIKKLQQAIKTMINNEYIKSQYPEVLERLHKYNIYINKKIKKIYEFQIFNSAIKNTTINLSNLLNMLPKINNGKIVNINDDKTIPKNQYANKVISTISNIFLSKNTFDIDFVQNIDIKYFENISIREKKLKNFNTIFLANLKTFKKLFPKYIKLLKDITLKDGKYDIENIKNSHIGNIAKNLKIIKKISYILISFVIFTILATIFFIILLREDNKKLNNLTKRLYKRSVTDRLTGLYNINKYDRDIIKVDNPILFVINIDKFKNINSYFGTKIGDKLLKNISEIIQKITYNQKKANFYRFGSDEFGILYSKRDCNKPLYIAQILVEYFESNDITIDGVDFRISISIGISDTSPYFEKAGIALKYVKDSNRLKFFLYDKKIDNEYIIKENIKKTKILHEAIINNNVIAYFQPIVDENGKIIKYEMLSRVKHNDGKIESIYPYLNIAKENKLYAKITKLIIKEAFNMLSNNQSIYLNINLSTEDMIDEKIVEIIKKFILEHKNIAKRVTFEILESEAIDDYESIEYFIKKIKEANAKIAIDDFGSGYSNFLYLMKLNVDFVKIDGSIIKNILKDNNALKIVELLQKFAKDGNIKTVAEFVENEEIYKKLKDIGIDLYQGYYFYEPLPNIKEE